MGKGNKTEKEKALKNTINSIRQEFGEGSIMRLGNNQSMNVKTIPTGAINIDIALGVGGIPKGRIIEIYGNESSGKTTLGLHIIAEAQNQDGTAAFIDVEHALDPNYAENLGINIDNLLISQPDNGEEALEIVESLIRSNAIDVIIIDSVAALVPTKELEGKMGDSHVALQARLMSQAMRKLSGAISKSKTACIFINQIREKVDVNYGNPETTSGGRALKFYSSVRMEVRRTESLKKGNDIIGNRTRIKVVKNKLAPPFRKAEFDIMYGEGISREGDLIDLASDLGIVNKSGPWYSYGEDRLGQGKENAKNYLQDNPEIAQAIELQVKKHYNLDSDDKAISEDEEKATDKKAEKTNESKKDKNEKENLKAKE